MGTQPGSTIGSYVPHLGEGAQGSQLSPAFTSTMLQSEMTRDLKSRSSQDRDADPSPCVAKQRQDQRGTEFTVIEQMEPPPANGSHRIIYERESERAGAKIYAQA